MKVSNILCPLYHFKIYSWKNRADKSVKYLSKLRHILPDQYAGDIFVFTKFVFLKTFENLPCLKKSKSIGLFEVFSYRSEK